MSRQQFGTSRLYVVLSMLCVFGWACQEGQIGDSVDEDPAQSGQGGNNASATDADEDKDDPKLGGTGGKSATADASQGGSGGVSDAGGRGGSAFNSEGGKGMVADAGAPVVRTDASISVPSDAAPNVGTVPRVVAVGNAGKRSSSRDLGLTWAESQQLASSGGDDGNLLRDVEYGAGLFVAVGWKILTSIDGGHTWVEQKNPRTQWLGGVAYGNGVFVAGGGTGYVARSKDGISWTALAGVRNAIRRVSFRDGNFYASADGGTVYRSQDGNTWATVTDAFPEKQYAIDGVLIRLNNGRVERSTDMGKTWKAGAGGSFEGVAAGYIP